MLTARDHPAGEIPDRQPSLAGGREAGSARVDGSPAGGTLAVGTEQSHEPVGPVHSCEQHAARLDGLVPIESGECQRDREIETALEKLVGGTCHLT